MVGRKILRQHGRFKSPPKIFEGRAAARKPSSSSSSSRHVFGTVTTTQSTAFTVSTTSTHAQVLATVTSVTTSDASNSGEVRVSFLFYSASGSCGSACLSFSRLVFGRLVFSLSAGIFFVYTFSRVLRRCISLGTLVGSHFIWRVFVLFVSFFDSLLSYLYM